MVGSAQFSTTVVGHLEGGERPAGARVLLHEVTGTEAEAAFGLAERCAERYENCEDSRFCCDVTVLAHQLPERIRRSAREARLDDRLHALVFSGNTPVTENLEDTPAHWQAAGASDNAAAFLLMLYGALLGDFIAWSTQQDGRLVTDVLPIAGAEQSLLSSSSWKALGWHTEDAFSSSRADYVGLLCLRNPDHTPTSVSYVDVENFPVTAREVLKESRFHIMPDSSHEFGEGCALPGDRTPNAPARQLVPLLSGPHEAPILRADRDYTTPVDGDQEAAAAMTTLFEHLDRNLYPLILKPGDIAFIDNRNVVHGRYSFVPRYDGRDRWLKRVNVIVDLRRTRSNRANATTRVIG